MNNPTEPLEKDIQSAICDYLAIKNHFFWRQNVIPAMTPGGSMRRLPKYVKKGVPDIIVIKDGFFIGLEVKRKGGQQSDSQKEFEKGLKEAGGEYYVVRSIDDVINIGL